MVIPWGNDSGSNLLYQRKNQSKRILKVFQDYLDRYDFYKYKHLTLVKKKFTSNDEIWEENFLIRLKDLGIVRRSIQILILLNVNLLYRQCHQSCNGVLNQLATISSIINAPIRLSLIITGVIPFEYVARLNQYQEKMNLSSCVDFSINADGKISNSEFRKKFNEASELILLQLYEMNLSMHQKIDKDCYEKLLRIPIFFTLIKSMIDRFLIQVKSTLPKDMVDFKHISMHSTFTDELKLETIYGLIQFNRFLKKCCNMYYSVKRKPVLFVGGICFFSLFLFVFVSIRDCIQINSVDEIVKTQLKTELKLSIKNDPFKFLDYIRRISKLTLSSVITFPYVELNNRIQSIKQKYLKYMLMKHTKIKLESVLNDVQIPFEKRYLYFLTYLMMGSRIDITIIPKIFISRWESVHDERLKWIRDTLIRWYNHRMPSLVLDELLLKKYKLLIKKGLSPKAYVLILESYFNKREVYSIGFYKNFFDNYLNDLLVLEALFSKLYVARGLMDSNIITQLKNKIYNEYIRQYFKYWMDKIEYFRFPPINSIESGVRVLENLAKNNSDFKRTLKAFNKNIHSFLLQNKHPPNSIMEMDAWVSNEKNIQPFQAKILSISGELKNILEMKNSNEIFLKLLKDQIKGGNKVSLLIRLSNLQSGMPSLLKKYFKRFEHKIISLIINRAVDEINRQWKANVLTFYQKNIESYYPINSLGHDVPVDLFFKFFGENGIFLKFYMQEIKPFLCNSKCSSLSNQVKERLVHLTPLINRFLCISRKFYPSDHNSKAKFLIQPLLMNHNCKNIRLIIDDLSIDYSYGPLRTFLYQWPNNARSKKVLFVCNSFSGDIIRATINGSWAFFRLLEKNNVDLSKNDFHHTFKVCVANCFLTLNINSFTK